MAREADAQKVKEVQKDLAASASGAPGVSGVEKRLLQDSGDDALLVRLRALDDAALQVEFDKFTDITDSAEKEKHHMTRDGLAKVLAALNLKHNVVHDEIEGLMAQVVITLYLRNRGDSPLSDCGHELRQ